MSRRIGRNIVANGIGRIWAVLSNVILVPVYIRLMGGESYGLVVAYATVIASLQVLDAGWSNLLSRQLALRVDETGAPVGAPVANLAKTIEIISWATGAAIGVSLVLLAPAIADKWLITRTLPRRETVEALRLIGLILAVQWPSLAYQGALMGLQEQVRVNAVKVLTSTVQAFGAAWLLWKIAPTVRCFFLCVLLVQTLNTLWLRRLVWGKIPLEQATRPRFDWQEVLGAWRFALGVAGIALLASVLTQADKLVLSRTVPLAELATYGVAFTVCSALTLGAGPVLLAVLPRLTQLSRDHEEQALRSVYFRSCELVALIVVPAWSILCFHAGALMTLWMGAGERAAATAILLPVLGFGSLANAIVTLPYGLQIGSGWTSLSVLKNIVAVAVLFPALLWAIAKYGTLGAAAIWAAINCGYLIFEIPIMHRRLLKGEALRWYFRAFLLPVSVGAAVGAASRYVAPAAGASKLEMLLFLAVCFGVATVALGFVLPSIRRAIRDWLAAGHFARG